MLYALLTCLLFKGSVPYYYSAGRIKVIRIKHFLRGNQSQQYTWEIAAKFNQSSGLLTNSHSYKSYTSIYMPFIHLYPLQNAHTYRDICFIYYIYIFIYILVAITHAYVQPSGFHRRCSIYFKLLALLRSVVELFTSSHRILCSLISDAEKQRI